MGVVGGEEEEGNVNEGGKGEVEVGSGVGKWVEGEDVVRGKGEVVLMGEDVEVVKGGVMRVEKLYFEGWGVDKGVGEGEIEEGGEGLGVGVGVGVVG